MAVETKRGLAAGELSRVATVAALVVAAVAVYLAVGDPRSLINQTGGFLGNLAAFVFATVCGFRLARQPSPARRAWVLMSVATGLASLSVASYAVSSSCRTGRCSART